MKIIYKNKNVEFKHFKFSDRAWHIQLPETFCPEINQYFFYEFDLIYEFYDDMMLLLLVKSAIRNAVENKNVPINSFLPKNITEGVVFCGFRHGQCIYSKCAVTGLRDAESGDSIQGFLTSLNRFVDRQEAWNIAKEANQIIKVTGGEGTLYSEDIF